MSGTRWMGSHSLARKFLIASRTCGTTTFGSEGDVEEVKEAPSVTDAISVGVSHQPLKMKKSLSLPTVAPPKDLSDALKTFLLRE